MAQNITLMGASYSDVPAVELPKTGGGTASFTDVTDTTAAASDVASGKYFYTAAGTRTQGTASGGGGGSSSWTKVAETSYQISTSSTATTVFATWETGHSELWTSDKWVYVRIRDTAGKRNAYFYGTDAFMTNVYPVNSGSTTSNSSGIIYGTLSVDANGNYTFRHGNSSTVYGVYPSRVYPNGDIAISTRYNSSYTRTINGTYSVAVYLLDPPTGSPIFT